MEIRPQSIFRQTLIASKRQISFYSALDFSPNCPHWVAKSALLKIKFTHFRRIMFAQTCSNAKLAFSLSICLFSSLFCISQSHQFFNPRGTFFSVGTAQHRTASVSMADVDGDGDLDAVIANGRHWAEQNYVFILTKGGYKIARLLGKELSTTYAAPLADLDGDGDLDILTGNDMAPNRIFLNDGKGHFSEKGFFGELEAPTRSLLLADINTDGHTDVLITNRGKANEICFNDGKANFSRCVPFGNKDDSTIDVIAADMNQDGKVDLILANRDKQQNYIYLNKGNGAFDETGIPFGTGRDETRSVAVVDLNKDGFPDIVTGNIREANVIYFGDKDLRFDKTLTIGAPDESTYHLLAEDINLDGHIDIITANNGSPCAVYFNDGKATAFKKVNITDESYDTYQIAVGKINGDALPDIILANSDFLNLYFLSRKK